MRVLRSLLVLLGGVAGTGCGEWGSTPSLTLETRPFSTVAEEASPPELLESGPHLIRVRRTFRVADPCQALAGDLAYASGELTLRVVARPGTGGCQTGEDVLSYVATIEGLRPGRYNLRVIHGPTGKKRSPAVVLSHPVVVERPSVGR